MNDSQLVNFDDDHGDLEVAITENADGSGRPTGFAGELSNAGAATRSLNTTAIVLGIIVMAGTASIFSMRWVATADADGESASDTAGLLAMLPELRKAVDEAGAESQELSIMRNNPTERQVPSSDLLKDPFVIPAVDKLPDLEVPAATRGPVGPTPEELREQHLAAIEQAANTVRVSSVLSGASPLAIVDGVAVRLGDPLLVDEWEFTVASIDADGVTLSYSDPLLKQPVRVLRGINAEPATPQSRSPRTSGRPTRPR